MKSTSLQFLFITLVLSLTTYKSIAQESMIPEVSYPFLEKLIASARENYPRVKAQAEKTSAARADVNAASVSWLDPFSFSYYYRPNDSKVNIGDLNTILYNGPQYGININLGSILQKPFTIRKAKNNLNIAKLESDEYDLKLVVDVKTRYYNYIQQMTALRVISRTTLDYEALNREVKSKFEKGQETLFGYNQTLTQLASAYQQKIAVEAALLTSKSSLEELVGKNLEEIK